MGEPILVVDATSADQALAKHRSAIEAIPEKETMTCAVSGAVLVETGRKTVPLLASDKEAILAAFKAPPMADMEQVEERAMAVWAAEKQVEAADPTPATNLPALYVEGGSLKDVSVKVLDLLAGNDAEVRRTLKIIQPGSGYRDMADDLTAIHPLLLSRQAAIVATTIMTDAQIDRVGELAPLLLAPKKAEPTALKAARLLRDRAWTYYLRSYNEIMRHVTFIHTNAPDKLDAYPNIFYRPGAGRSGSGGKKSGGGK
jgi:hypothetical protein